MSGNTAVSAVSPSASATVHVASNGNYHTGQIDDTARDYGFDITGLESNCKPIKESESSHELRTAQASDSFRVVPGKGLVHESCHTPASAEGKCASGDEHARAGVDLSKISGPVVATTPVGERETGANGSRREKVESSDDRKEEKTATVVIGKFLARLPLSKLKIIIGANYYFVEVGVEFLYSLLSLKKGILLSYYPVRLLWLVFLVATISAFNRTVARKLENCVWTVVYLLCC